MRNQEFGNQPNLLILGASGGVANALLQLLHTYRNSFNKLILLDKRDDITKSPYLNHQKLNYSFVQMYINGHIPISELAALMTTENIDIVLDLTDSETLPILHLCNDLGISYMNSSINIESMSVYQLFQHLESIRDTCNNASHLVSMGMNPGIVNIWVIDAIKKYGIPQELIEIEHDNASPVGAWKPVITWSKKQFLTESCWDPTGRTILDGAYENLYPNAMAHTTATEEYLKDLWPMEKYPIGMIVAHDEIMSLGSKYKIPAKFIYAINQPTHDYLKNKFALQQQITEQDLNLADNTEITITGQDTIAMILKYADKKVIISNTMHHANFHSTNATLMQVAIGVLTGLKELMQNNLPKRINYPEDLSIEQTLTTIKNHMTVDTQVIHHKAGSKKAKPTQNKNSLVISLTTPLSWSLDFIWYN